MAESSGHDPDAPGRASPPVYADGNLVDSLTPDAALAKAAAAGSRQAFAQLVRRYEFAAFAWAAHATGDDDTAVDVCRDAFGFAHARVGSDPPDVSRWLLTSCFEAAGAHGHAEAAGNRDLDALWLGGITYEALGHLSRGERDILVRDPAVLGERERQKVLYALLNLGEQLEARGVVGERSSPPIQTSRPHLTTSLGVYALGTLDPDESADIRRHLEDCSGCRAVVGDLEGLVELIAASRLVREPPVCISDMVLAEVSNRRATGTEVPSKVGSPGAGPVGNLRADSGNLRADPASRPGSWPDAITIAAGESAPSSMRTRVVTILAVAALVAAALAALFSLAFA